MSESTSPGIFIARQPLLNERRAVFGYELMIHDPSGETDDRQHATNQILESLASQCEQSQVVLLQLVVAGHLQEPLARGRLQVLRRSCTHGRALPGQSVEPVDQKNVRGVLSGLREESPRDSPPPPSAVPNAWICRSDSGPPMGLDDTELSRSLADVDYAPHLVALDGLRAVNDLNPDWFAVPVRRR